MYSEGVIYLSKNREVVVGSVIVGKVEKDRLIACPFARLVLFRFGRPFCLCSLGSGYCSHFGKRAKVAFHFNGFRVVSICEKLVGLPDLER